MGRCFVIQPFDNKGPFDRRYDDVLVPATKDGGFEAYRVDRDPSVQIPIEEIQSQIELAEACLADISTDNPNVWFELGYAYACKREVVLICSENRKTPFPFDVQHRSIIKYKTDSMSDFQEMQTQITARLKSIAQRKIQLGGLARVSSVSRMKGLEQYEVATLVSVAQEMTDFSGGGLSVHQIRNDLEYAGFTKIASTLGLKSLVDKGMLEAIKDSDQNGNDFTSYRVTNEGMSWLFENRSQLSLTREPPTTNEIPF